MFSDAHKAYNGGMKRPGAAIGLRRTGSAFHCEIWRPRRDPAASAGRWTAFLNGDYLRSILSALLITAMALPAHAQVTQSRVRMRSCAQADSLLGRVPNGRHDGIFASEIVPGSLRLTTGGYPDIRRSETHVVSFTITARPEPLLAPPQGFLSASIEGPAGLALLRGGVAPALMLQLPDSITIRTNQVTLGKYTGPDAFAVAPLNAVLTSPSLLALARASEATLLVDSLAVPLPRAVLASLQDVYRTAVCGYAEPPPPN